jgi:hypothetical protein
VRIAYTDPRYIRAIGNRIIYTNYLCWVPSGKNWKHVVLIVSPSRVPPLESARRRGTGWTVRWCSVGRYYWSFREEEKKRDHQRVLCSVRAERPTNVALLASMSICNLSLKNWYEAFAMARCLP